MPEESEEERRRKIIIMMQEALAKVKRFFGNMFRSVFGD